MQNIFGLIEEKPRLSSLVELNRESCQWNISQWNINMSCHLTGWSKINNTIIISEGIALSSFTGCLFYWLFKGSFDAQNPFLKLFKLFKTETNWNINKYFMTIHVL